MKLVLSSFSSSTWPDCSYIIPAPKNLYRYHLKVKKKTFEKGNLQSCLATLIDLAISILDQIVRLRQILICMGHIWSTFFNKTDP